MSKKIELFVPGRLCLLGEHSDWAGKYRNVNNDIGKGYAIVTGIEEGVYATATISDKFVVKTLNGSKKFVSDMDEKSLKKVAAEGGYWSYVAGVAAVIKEQYNVSGVTITIKKTTIPVKKGLSSSAAICVLVARAFNQLYNLHLSTMGEMNIAYNGEIETPSRCGRLDQACAFGQRPILMTFDGDKIEVRDLKIGDDFYFVFADLKSQKDTVAILRDLNKCYPFPETDIDKNVHKGLGKVNEKNIFKAIDFLAEGNQEKFGELMIEAQKDFDKLVAPACPEELTSPVLHKMFDDKKVEKLCYGYKGVGSQGDGTIQFLSKGEKEQKELINYLKNKLELDAFSLKIQKTKPIKKAIIPLAGNGTRMYPITKIIKKAFLPIIDSDNIIKPAIMVILEELVDAGIEEICLVIDKDDRPIYDSFFAGELSEKIVAKLSKQALDYEQIIDNVSKKIRYVYQDEKLGLGHAVSLCKRFAGKEDVLLVLGDQIYKTSNNKSCTEQLLECYEKNPKLMVSAYEIPLEDAPRYGILTGTIEQGQNFFSVDRMTEKPETSYAEEYLYTADGKDKKYFSVFGEYIINSRVFEILDRNIKNDFREDGEFQITSVLDEVRQKDGMIAFIPDGEMLDAGTINSYGKTFNYFNNLR